MEEWNESSVNAGKVDAVVVAVVVVWWCVGDTWFGTFASVCHSCV